MADAFGRRRRDALPDGPDVVLLQMQIAKLYEDGNCTSDEEWEADAAAVSGDEEAPEYAGATCGEEPDEVPTVASFLSACHRSSF